MLTVNVSINYLIFQRPFQVCLHYKGLAKKQVKSGVLIQMS